MKSCELFSKRQKRATGCTVGKRPVSVVYVHVVQLHTGGLVMFHAFG